MAGVALRRGQYPSARREGDRAAGPSGARGGQTMYSQRLRSRTAGVAVSAIAIQVAASAGRPRATRAALLGGAWLGALAMLAPDAAQAQQGPFAYVPNRGDGTVSVIDTPTNAVAPTASLLACLRGRGRAGRRVAGLCHKPRRQQYCFRHQHRYEYGGRYHPRRHSPWILAVSPDGTRVYVPNQGSDTVSVINTASNTVVATIPAGSQPVGAGVSPDGARVYVTNTNANTVSVINSATNTVITTIPVGTAPTGVAVTPDGTRAYVTNAFSDNVSVINTATNTVVATIPIAGFIPTPQLVAVSPNGTRAYVTNAFTNNVSVIDTATNTVVATIPAGNQPTGVMVTPDGTRAYVTNFAKQHMFPSSTPRPIRWSPPSPSDFLRALSVFAPTAMRCLRPGSPSRPTPQVP